MIYALSHGTFGYAVTVAEPTEADAQWSLFEFQAEHPAVAFGPVVLAVTGEWVARGFVES